MALWDQSSAQRYDTPPGGDFVRYVEQLLARQSATGQVLVPTTTGTPTTRNAATAQSERRPAADATAAAGATGTAASKAQELLERIRQLEQARRTGTPAAASPPSLFTTPSQPRPAEGKSPVWDWLGAAVLTVAFPPVGLLRLASLLKKAMGKNK